MSWLALLAQVEPPAELAAWVGSMAVTAAVSGFIGTALKRSGQSDAEFRAKVLADFERVLEKLNAITLTNARLEEKVATMGGRIDQVEKRQDAQATIHRAEIAELREGYEMLRARLEELRRG